MKNYKLFIGAKLLLLVLLFSACEKDPFEAYNERGGSHERAIVSLFTPGQIGVAEINRGIEEASATLYVIEGTNLSNMEFDLKVSPYAQVLSGNTYNFDNPDSTATISVQSQSGKIRDWNVRVKGFKDNLAATWTINAISLDWHIGPGESWGWGGTAPIEKYFPNMAKAYDDELSFTIEGVRENGNLYGTFTHTPGLDGEYGDFIATIQNAPADKDYNENYRLLPKGEVSWERDFAANVVVFNKGTEEETQSTALIFSEDNQELTLAFMPQGLQTLWEGGDPQYPVMELTSPVSLNYELLKQ